MVPEVDRRLDRKTLIELAKRELEARIVSLRSSIQSEIENYKRAPDARESWSDTTRSRVEDITSELQRQLSEQQKKLELFRTLGEGLTESIGEGSLAKVDEEGQETFFLLLPAGGARIEISEPKLVVYSVSTASPVGRALSGHREGEIVEVKAPDGVRRLKIEEVW